MPQDLEIVPIRSGVCFGRCGAVLLLAYREAPTCDDLRQREALIAKMTASSPAGAFLSIIDASVGTPLPDPESRAESTRQLARHAGFLRAGALIVRGSGVRVTLLRSFLRGLLVMRSSPFPTRFFGDVTPAARFCLDALGGERGIDPSQLSRAAEQVERACV